MDSISNLLHVELFSLKNIAHHPQAPIIISDTLSEFKSPMAISETLPLMKILSGCALHLQARVPNDFFEQDEYF